MAERRQRTGHCGRSGGNRSARISRLSVYVDAASFSVVEGSISNRHDVRVTMRGDQLGYELIAGYDCRVESGLIGQIAFEAIAASKEKYASAALLVVNGANM